MWELAGSVARVLKNHAANIIFLCGSWLGHWGARLKIVLRTSFSCARGSWALGRTLKNDAANIIFLRGSWLALGRALKSAAANITFSRESAGRSSKASAHQFLIDRAMNFDIFWPTSGRGPFQLPATLFSYVARRTLKNDATNINFSCWSWPAPWRACLKIMLRTSLSYVGAGWAIGARA